MLLVCWVCVLWGCSQDTVSLTDTEWTYSNPNSNGVVELLFHEQPLCTVRRIVFENGEQVATQEVVGYRYTTPQVLLVFPAGEQVMGVFYDNHTRLELVWSGAEMTFYKSR